MKRSKAAAIRKEAAINSKSSLLKNIERADDLKIHPLTYHTDVLVTLDHVSGFYLDSADSTAFPVFNKKSFTVKRGDRIALQGPNGCGKSSTFAAVTDEAPVSLPEFTGNLHVGSGLVISYVPQTTAGLCGTLDTYASRRSIDITLLKTILRKLDFSRLQFEKNIEDYSEGQKKKVLLAASLCENAHLYIWDEPLNYIDVLSRMQIENLLLQFQPTMIFVEHDKAFCDNVATETVLL